MTNRASDSDSYLDEATLSIENMPQYEGIGVEAYAFETKDWRAWLKDRFPSSTDNLANKGKLMHSLARGVLAAAEELGIPSEELPVIVLTKGDIGQSHIAFSDEEKIFLQYDYILEPASTFAPINMIFTIYV